MLSDRAKPSHGCDEVEWDISGFAKQPLAIVFRVFRHDLAVGVPKGAVESKTNVTLLGGAAKPFHGLGMVLRQAVTIGVHEKEFVGPTFASLAKPLHGFGIILWHTLAVGVFESEVVLGTGVALISGFAVPPCRFSVVLRYAVAVVVPDTEVGLGPSVTLLGGLAVPSYSFGLVFRHAPPVVVQFGKCE